MGWWRCMFGHKKGLAKIEWCANVTLWHFAQKSVSKCPFLRWTYNPTIKRPNVHGSKCHRGKMSPWTFQVGLNVTVDETWVDVTSRHPICVLNIAEAAPFRSWTEVEETIILNLCFKPIWSNSSNFQDTNRAMIVENVGNQTANQQKALNVRIISGPKQSNLNTFRVASI